MQARQGAVERLAAARDLDFLARLFQRFQAEDVPQEEAERAGDVILQRRRAEDALRAELPRDGGDGGRVAEQAVVGRVLALAEAVAQQHRGVGQVRCQVRR